MRSLEITTKKWVLSEPAIYSCDLPLSISFSKSFFRSFPVYSPIPENDGAFGVRFPLKRRIIHVRAPVCPDGRVPHAASRARRSSPWQAARAEPTQRL
jgi:hypothetical protein